ncbi:hypothetical protein CEK25_007662 [Fusarium fujikuroi]|nr:hypothetical protein CEK25_007662 [Fusarium fujikuroi]
MVPQTQQIESRSILQVNTLRHSTLQSHSAGGFQYPKTFEVLVHKTNTDGDHARIATERSTNHILHNNGLSGFELLYDFDSKLEEAEPHCKRGLRAKTDDLIKENLSCWETITRLLLSFEVSDRTADGFVHCHLLPNREHITTHAEVPTTMNNKVISFPRITVALHMAPPTPEPRAYQQDICVNRPFMTA